MLRRRTAISGGTRTSIIRICQGKRRFPSARPVPPRGPADGSGGLALRPTIRLLRLCRSRVGHPSAGPALDCLRWLSLSYRAGLETVSKAYRDVPLPCAVPDSARTGAWIAVGCIPLVSGPVLPLWPARHGCPTRSVKIVKLLTDPEAHPPHRGSSLGRLRASDRLAPCSATSDMPSG